METVTRLSTYDFARYQLLETNRDVRQIQQEISKYTN